jgi:hypothetical protein
LFMPVSSARRASSSKAMVFGIGGFPPLGSVVDAGWR